MGGVVNVATMFTDLVDSTALATRLGPEAAEVLRREHFALLRGAAADGDGREVKNLGDGLMLVFDRASAALTAAVEMQRALDHRNRTTPQSEPLRVRIGIAVGEADLDDDGDVFGPPVVEAARLCGVAGGGQILVTDLVRALVGRRGGFEFVPRGEQELKGLPAPLEVYEVTWSPVDVDDESKVPLPTRLARVPDVFAGRADELGLLNDRWKHAMDGDGHLVVLSGEAGIGKTSLVATFARQVHDEGATVLYGRCDEDLGVAYGPWLSSLSHLVDHVDDAVLGEKVAARGGELVRLIPALGHRLGATPSTGADPEAERYLLFAAVVDLLEQAAPLVLVLDDLHWADRPTLQLLRHLVAADHFSKILVIATYRSTDVDDAHPLVETLAAIHRTDRADVIHVAGLDDLEVLDLMEATAGHQLGNDGIALRDALVAETAGNPFFVGELLRHLAETGAIVQGADGRWVAGIDLATTGLPVSVRVVVGRRVARLGPAVEDALRSASVIGREFDLSLLSSVTGSSADELIDLLEPAVRAALVDNVSADRFSFVHALVEHALYDSMTPARRARVHRRVAEALEAVCGDDPGSRAGELAHHWSQATVPADARRVVDYARMAGERALAALAPDEAARWFRRALELLEAGSGDGDVERVRCAVMVRLGDALRQAGDPSHRELLLDAARMAIDLRERELLVAAALANQRGQVSANGLVDHQRVEVLDAALAALGDDEGPDLARLSATLAMELTYSPEQRRFEAADRAIEVAWQCGDRDAMLDVVALTTYLYSVPAAFDERDRLTAAALELSAHGTDRVRRWNALVNRRAVAVELGDRATARGLVGEAASIAAETDLPYLKWAMGYVETLEALLDGDLEGSESRANETFAIGSSSGQLDAFTIYGGQLLGVRYHQGRIGELIDLLATALVETPAVAAYHAGLPAALAQAGRLDEATSALEQFVARIDDLHLDLTWLATMVMAADAALMVAHRPAGERLYGLLEPYRHRVGVIGHILCFGPVAHRLGCLAALLGRPDEATAHLEAAAELAARLDSPIHRAAVDLDRALLIERREPGRAAALRDEAHRLLDAHAIEGLPAATGRWHP